MLRVKCATLRKFRCLRLIHHRSAEDNESIHAKSESKMFLCFFFVLADDRIDMRLNLILLWSWERRAVV